MEQHKFPKGIYFLNTVSIYMNVYDCVFVTVWKCEYLSLYEQYVLNECILYTISYVPK